ncbi:MAG: PQQ-binding-like beta-propeller repeat protein [Limisphaerales bacterium]
MNKLTVSILFAALCVSASDWNQWRGPNRNGVLPGGPKLADVWSTDGPKLVWESEAIPGNDLGGHGSAVIADGKVFMSVVWHTDLPSDTRTIDSLVLRKLGSRGTSGIPPEKIAALDELVLNLSPRVRGSKLDAMANKWVDENLDAKQKMNLGSYIVSRFKKGRKNVPFADFEKINKVRDKVFPNDQEFKAWVTSQGFSEFVQQQIIKAVPPTHRVAKDTIVCIDLKSGKTLWKAEAPGEPKGRNCSSTPAVADGHIYGVGSTHLYCVDIKTGKIKWAAPTHRKGTASSPLVVDGVVVLHSNDVTGYDAKTGEEKWNHPKARVTNASPVAWRKNDKTLIISHTRSALSAYDPKTGEEQWSIPAGGDSTPAIQGDLLAVQCKSEKVGFLTVKLGLESAKPVWNHPMVGRRTQASPIIDGDKIYLIENTKAMAFETKTGKVLYEQMLKAGITSPAMADGKIYMITDRGNNLTMLRPGKDDMAELGRLRIKALSCPSPTIANGYAVVRQLDKLVAYDLTEGQSL